MRHSQVVMTAARCAKEDLVSGVGALMNRIVGGRVLRRAMMIGCMTGALGVASMPLTSTRVSAQDMSFGLEETEGGDSAGKAAGKSNAPAPKAAPKPPPEEGPPSEALSNALRLYQDDRHQEAAVQLQRIVEGDTQDSAGNQQKAQFFLGKSLYHLGYYQSSLAIFDEISQQGTGHLFFDQALQWLAQLASQLPEPAGIIEKVGRYELSQIEQFNNGEGKPIYAQLLYLLGRSKYSQGEFEQAISLFEQVPSSSKWYVQARMFAGISHIRMRQARPAIQAFRSIIDALEAGDVEAEEKDRVKDLAWLSLARVYYTAANKVDENTGERDVDGRLLGAAVDAWSRVDVGSEYWLDALFEGSFAFFLADEFSRAMGNIHTVFSPYFENSYYPEALVLKSVIFFYNCQMENAAAMVQKFHERYDPVQTELQAKLNEFKDNESFYKFLEKVRAGEETRLSPAIRGVVSTALSDRTVLRHLEYVKQLEAEEAKLKGEPVAFKSSSVGARILQDAALAKSFAIEQTGDLARGRYTRLISELQDFMNQIDAVDLEVATFERGQLSQAMQEQQVTADRAAGGRVEVDEEHQVWPFDGEYWRDELGFYRQQVTSQCGR
jgi:TolA-binding protein